MILSHNLGDTGFFLPQIANFWKKNMMINHGILACPIANIQDYPEL